MLSLVHNAYVCKTEIAMLVDKVEEVLGSGMRSVNSREIIIDKGYSIGYIAKRITDIYKVVLK